MCSALLEVQAEVSIFAVHRQASSESQCNISRLQQRQHVLLSETKLCLAPGERNLENSLIP